MGMPGTSLDDAEVPEGQTNRRGKAWWAETSWERGEKGRVQQTRDVWRRGRWVGDGGEERVGRGTGGWQRQLQL